MKIIKSQSGEFTRSKGKEVMEAFLKAEGKNINAVYAHNDDMAMGAIQAIEEAGLKPGTDVILVSHRWSAEKGVVFEAMVAKKKNTMEGCNLLRPPAFAVVAVVAVDSGGHAKNKVLKEEGFYHPLADEVIPCQHYEGPLQFLFF